MKMTNAWTATIFFVAVEARLRRVAEQALDCSEDTLQLRKIERGATTTANTSNTTSSAPTPPPTHPPTSCPGRGRTHSTVQADCELSGSDLTTSQHSDVCRKCLFGDAKWTHIDPDYPDIADPPANHGAACAVVTANISIVVWATEDMSIATSFVESGCWNNIAPAELHLNELTVLYCPPTWDCSTWNSTFLDSSLVGRICPAGPVMGQWETTSNRGGGAPIAGHVCTAPHPSGADCSAPDASGADCLLIAPMDTPCVPKFGHSSQAAVRVHDITEKIFPEGWEAAFEWCKELAEKFEITGTDWTGVDATSTLMASTPGNVTLMEVNDHHGLSKNSGGNLNIGEAHTEATDGVAARKKYSFRATTTTGHKEVLAICMNWMGDATNTNPGASSGSTDTDTIGAPYPNSPSDSTWWTACPSNTERILVSAKQELERMSFNAISIGFHVLPVNLEFLRGRQAMMVHRSGSTATEAGTTGAGMMTGQGFDNMLYDTFVERPSWQTQTCTSSNTAGCGALAKHVYTSTNLLTQFNGQDHVESNLYNQLLSGSNSYLDPLLSNSAFDLVLLMIPSSLPAGTAGLGYIGRSGSIVAGCEAKQDYECVHTIVHELGHNFGLRHANSPSRNYGNIYDFMGNTYAMQGTSFSAAASAEVLGWIPSSNYVSITASSVNGGSPTQVILKPFDGGTKSGSDTLALKIALGTDINADGYNTETIWIALRTALTEDHDGVYIVENYGTYTQLLDCGCHTPSVRDARLLKSWTYIEPSNSVGITVVDVSSSQATLTIFYPQASQIASYRSQVNFTDGRTVCPRTCVDSDYLVPYNHGGIGAIYTCARVAELNLCTTERSVYLNTQYVTVPNSELCMVSCNACSTALAGDSSLTSCSDSNLTLEAPDATGSYVVMVCADLASNGYCTHLNPAAQSGRVEDVCRFSCNKDGCAGGAGNLGTGGHPPALRLVFFLFLALVEH